MKNILVSYKCGDDCCMCICNSWDAVHAEIFNTSKEDVYITDFSLHGNNYSDRKECARDIAINVQSVLSDAPVSYKELWIIQQELDRIARKAGLLREFRENAII